MLTGHPEFLNSKPCGQDVRGPAKYRKLKKIESHLSAEPVSFLDVDWGTANKGWALELDNNVMGDLIYLNARLLFSGAKCKLRARSELHGILGLIFGGYL